MLAFLRNVIIAVLGAVAIFLGGVLIASKTPTSSPQAITAPAVETRTASSSKSGTAPSSGTAAATKPPPAAHPATTTGAKPPIPAAPTPQPSTVLTPGTPEYQKSLQDALDALAKLNASAGPATALNDRVRAAVININCAMQLGGGAVKTISGSGVVIDPKGVIVTNSHVAQYFLLKDYPTPNALSCVIRTGSPAYPAYTAELLFMPPTWMAMNAQKIKDLEPTGRGEHDYALLRITGSVNPANSLPASLPYLAPSYDEPSTGTTVLIAGYAAGFLGGAELAKNLYASSSYGKIGEIYTYGNNTADIFSLGGSIVAQQGSSGGAVANENGNLVGVVVTSTITADTATRDLKALTVPYIAEDFKKESGVSLPDYLSGNLAQEAASFNLGVAPTLTKELTNALTQP